MDIQEGEHKYHILQRGQETIVTPNHVLEGAGNNSDTNTDVQKGQHKYHILDGEKLEGEEGEEQG